MLLRSFTCIFAARAVRRTVCASVFLHHQGEEEAGTGGRQVGSDVSSDFKILADTQEGQIVVNSEASSGENTTPVHAQHRLQATLGLLVRARRSSRHNKHYCICCVGLVKSTLNGFQTFMTLKTRAISRQLILEYCAPHPFFFIIIIF